MISYYWQVTLVLSLLIICTRSLPFVFARFMNERFNQIGKLLPSYIMLLLVVYEINLNTLSKPPYGLPAFLTLGTVLLVHLWLRNTFFSLILGTSLYIYLSLIAFK